MGFSQCLRGVCWSFISDKGRVVWSASRRFFCVLFQFIIR
nr:MAG TPA: hypothetical protein [Caudoviricetes sp.]